MKQRLVNQIREAYNSKEKTSRTSVTLPFSLLAVIEERKTALSRRYGIRVTRDQLIAVALTEALS